MTEREQFNAAYWGSKPPEVQALSGMERLTIERIDAAQQLAAKGFVIDAEIDAYGLNPWDTMRHREMNGYTWYPSIFQGPVINAPGQKVPGVADYDPNNPPKGSIPVSSKIEDYPPFLPATVVETPAVPQGVPWFARPLGLGKCAVMPGDNAMSGATYTTDGKTWVKQIVAGPFGAWSWWEVRA